MSAVNPDFDAFQLPDSHRQLRAAVRELSEAQIEPYAADVDENARYPQEAHDALVASAASRSAVILGHDVLT